MRNKLERTSVPVGDTQVSHNSFSGIYYLPSKCFSQDVDVWCYRATYLSTMLYIYYIHTSSSLLYNFLHFQADQLPFITSIKYLERSAESRCIVCDSSCDIKRTKGGKVIDEIFIGQMRDVEKIGSDFFSLK